VILDAGEDEFVSPSGQTDDSSNSLKQRHRIIFSCLIVCVLIVDYTLICIVQCPILAENLDDKTLGPDLG
jgi:hypothetical protein